MGHAAQALSVQGVSGAGEQKKTHHRPQATQYPVVIPNCVRH